MLSPFTIQFLFGTAITVAGAELVMRGSVNLVRKRFSTALVSLLFVLGGHLFALFIITLQSGATGSPDIAIGSLFGATTTLLLFLTGFCALHTPLATSAAIKHDSILMLAAMAAFTLFARDGELTRMDGLLLCAGAVFYLLYAVRGGMARAFLPLPKAPTKECHFCAAAYIFIGLGLLTTGGDIAIDGAAAVASRYHLPEGLIGLLGVGFLALLPLTATLAVNAQRRQGETVLAALISCSIFNILAISGLSAIATPIAVSGRFLGLDFGLLLAAGLLAVLLSHRPQFLGKLTAPALIALYLAYGVYQYAFAQ